MVVEAVRPSRKSPIRNSRILLRTLANPVPIQHLPLHHRVPLYPRPLNSLSQIRRRRRRSAHLPRRLTGSICSSVAPSSSLTGASDRTSRFLLITVISLPNHPVSPIRLLIIDSSDPSSVDSLLSSEIRGSGIVPKAR